MDRRFYCSQREIGIQRLQKLATYLREVKPKAFDLSWWADIDVDTEISAAQARTMIKEGACGTTACAVGHACMIPEFQKIGLRLNLTSSVYQGSPYFRGEEGMGAAANFFKLSYDEAASLFDPVYYDDTRTSKYYVIRKIESQIKRMQKQINVAKRNGKSSVTLDKKHESWV